MYILFFFERYPHGIFGAGGAFVPAQEKKRKKKTNETNKHRQPAGVLPHKPHGRNYMLGREYCHVN